MNCCGRQRAESSANYGGRGNEGSPIRLTYGGVQTILVRGSHTGSVYRFAPGTSQRVHGGDAPSMFAIPGLRQADADL
jgi:hypothetical protein